MEVIKMYNYQKLRGLITEHYGTLGNFANAMNMGTTTLYSRLNGITFFDQEEIEKISKKFNLTTDDINAVFFTHK